MANCTEDPSRENVPVLQRFCLSVKKSKQECQMKTRCILRVCVCVCVMRTRLLLAWIGNGRNSMGGEGSQWGLLPPCALPTISLPVKWSIQTLYSSGNKWRVIFF